MKVLGVYYETKEQLIQFRMHTGQRYWITGINFEENNTEQKWDLFSGIMQLLPRNYISFNGLWKYLKTLIYKNEVTLTIGIVWFPGAIVFFKFFIHNHRNHNIDQIISET